jgi:nitroimidazol reductase NimA-like FMN-containing flavoprotein (pyridoxamine 5'-phosphate oxidase superfamily)
MRRKDREANEELALEVIDQCPYAVLSTVLPDGQPYGIPLSPVRLGHFIYFHCAPEGKKIQALRHNPQVSIACATNVKPRSDDFSTEYESAIVTGKALAVTDREEMIRALRALGLRYTPDHMDKFDEAVAASLHRTSVWKVGIDTITGKEKKYDDQGREIKKRPE